MGLINDYLGYLAGRGYSPQPVRAYASGLLAFARRLAAGRLALGEVSADVVLRYLAYCRRALLPGRAGGNVYSIRDGRNVGYAPATINRRLAAVSGLFGYGAMRDPAAPGRNGALACGPAGRGGCPAAWTAPRPPRCWRASAPIRKGVPGH
jgi:integrase/recombinase XerC